jgi:hypothetical protein
MPVFDSFMEDWAQGNIIPDVDTIFVMLCTSAFVPDKQTQTTRADITNEVVGGGYPPGGIASALSSLLNVPANRLDITPAPATFVTVSLTARFAVYYKNNGGVPSGDPLVCWIDFGADKTVVATNFNVFASAPLSVQN